MKNNCLLITISLAKFYLEVEAKNPLYSMQLSDCKKNATFCGYSELKLPCVNEFFLKPDKNDNNIGQNYALLESRFRL
jgi:hypothetical protein